MILPQQATNLLASSQSTLEADAELELRLGREEVVAAVAHRFVEPLRLEVVEAEVEPTGRSSVGFACFVEGGTPADARRRPRALQDVAQRSGAWAAKG